MSKSRLHQLSELGQSVWVDTLSREMIESGELERLIEDDAVVGVTSNPSIFQKAFESGDSYDEQMRQLMEDEDDDREVFFKLAVTDVQNACDLLRPTWDEGNGRDGWVSLEVEPDIAYDTEKTTEQARRFNKMVDRPNVFIKIPATEPGLKSIEDSIAAGIPINVTLIFSLERHRQVAEAYIRGLERFVEDGGDPSTLASVASFFVSRVDTEADNRLDAIGGHDELKGKLGIANARLAYQVYLEVFSGPEWEALEAKGATKQRCLWASTSTKNKAYKDTLYAEELVAPDTVNTMPPALIDAVIDHGDIRGDTILEGVDEAKQVLADLEEAGVAYDDVIATIEREGVEKFAKSFADLIEGLESKLKSLVTA